MHYSYLITNFYIHLSFSTTLTLSSRPRMMIDTSNLSGSDAMGTVTEVVNGSSAKVWALRLANVTGTMSLTFDNDTTVISSSQNGSITTTGSSTYLSRHLPTYPLLPDCMYTCMYVIR